MPLDPQKKKELDLLFQKATGTTPQSVKSVGLLPIKDRLAQLNTKPTYGETVKTDLKDIGIDNAKAKSLLQPKQQNNNQMSPEQADNFLNKSTVGQIFSKETAQELPKAAYETLVGGATKFVKSALESPVNIVQGLQGKEMTTLDINDPVTGKPIGSYQTDFQNKILPAVESGQISPIKGTAQAVGGPLSGAADVLGASELASSGINLAKTGAVVGANATKKLAGDIVETGGEMISSAAKPIRDIVPNRSEFVSGQVSKALDLTQGDVSNIKLSTKNNAGEWIPKNNLIGATKKETLQLVNDFTKKQYNTVREVIGQVTTKYDLKNIPSVKKSLMLLQEQVKGVPGLEEVAKEVSNLSRAKSVSLSNIQRVKELLDDNFSLYKATGDVKEGTIKKGLANVRKELKTFIEKETKKSTGVDIAPLNNDVMTGKSIIGLAEKRSTRDLTRANVSLSDLGAFGVGTVSGTPLLGAAALFAKRIVETPTMQLKIAKFLSKATPEVKQVISKELLKGKVPEILKKEVTQSLNPSSKSIKNSSQTASIYTELPKSKVKSSKLSTPLEQEAKKYKSAEEFIKRQGEPLYHGTTRIFDKFDVEKTNIDRVKEFGGDKGIYLSPNSLVASKYAKSAQSSLLPKEKTLEILYKKDKTLGEIVRILVEKGESAVPDNLWKKTIELEKTNGIDYNIAYDIAQTIENSKSALPNQGIPGFGGFDPNLNRVATLPYSLKKKLGINIDDIKKERVIDSYINKDSKVKDIGYFTDSYNKETDNFISAKDKLNKAIQKAKKDGFDVIKFQTENSIDNTPEILVLDPSQIKTKSQLEQIWREANKK